MKIGFFDSGIGGITVLKEALRVMPKEDYIYFADTSHVPYGQKPKDEVKGYIFDAVDFILSFGVKALVVACNTATSIAIKDLRKEYSIPIIGMEPAVKPAVANTDGSGKRVLVFATPLTLKESKFKNLVSQVDVNNIVDFLPLPELVNYAEGLEFDEKIIIPYLTDKLSSFDLSQYGTVVLGCTHFPFFTKCFSKVFPQRVNIIDGACGTVKRLKSVLSEQNLLEACEGKVQFCSSGNGEKDILKMEEALRIFRNI
jgi:glutamate racemase